MQGETFRVHTCGGGVKAIFLKKSAHPASRLRSSFPLELELPTPLAASWGGIDLGRLREGGEMSLPRRRGAFKVILQGGVDSESGKPGQCVSTMCTIEPNVPHHKVWNMCGMNCASHGGRSLWPRTREGSTESSCAAGAVASSRLSQDP